MAYVLPTKAIDPALVGDSYHLAIGTTTPGQSSPDRIFGYLLAEGTKFEEHTDLNTKSALTQYSSPNLIDRDFVNWPRVTDGDFSGGAFQVNWLDTARYWDSDLDTRFAGYLMLNPRWQQKNTVTAGAGTADRIISWKFDIYGIVGGDMPASAYYRVSDLATFTPGIVTRFIGTDGESLFIGDGVNTIKKTTDNVVFTNVITTLPTFVNMWVVNQGTAGRFIYYTTNNTDLFKVDLATGTGGIVVPTGGARIFITDLCAYEAGVVIATRDIVYSGADLWFHDNASLNRIMRLDQYFFRGVTVCLGQIYATAWSVAGSEPPILVRVGQGSFEVVARFGAPLSLHDFAIDIGEPVCSGEFVYMVLQVPLFNNVSQQSYIAVYNALTGAIAHLPNFGTDSPQAGLQQLACAGRAVAFVDRLIGTPDQVRCTFQTNSLFLAGLPQYQPSGWLISSRFDFATPGISKQFRRILIQHAPLKAGEQIRLDAYVDTDPSAVFAGVTAPIPAGATVTNNVVGSSTTVLRMPQHTIGFGMTWALQLTAGVAFDATRRTTPVVYYVSIEVSVSWTWKFTVDCSSRRRLLNGDEDKQGLRAKDLVMMMHLAWENAELVTFYHPNGEQYTAAIEEAVFESENPLNTLTPEHAADLEGLWTLTLRDAVV